MYRGLVKHKALSLSRACLNVNPANLRINQTAASTRLPISQTLAIRQERGAPEGQFTEEGLGGVTKDKAEALRWYEKAAAHDDEDAASRLKELP